MKTIGQLANQFFAKNFMQNANRYSDFFSSWRQIVGDDLAAHSKIVELESNTLIIEADHPGWIQLLQMKHNDILRTVQKKYPSLAVNALTIRLRKENSRLSARPAPEAAAPEHLQRGVDGVSPEASKYLQQGTDEGSPEASKYLQRGVDGVSPEASKYSHPAETFDSPAAAPQTVQEVLQTISDADFREQLRRLGKAIKK